MKMKFCILLLLIITLCSSNIYAQINFTPLPNQPVDNIVSVVIDPTTDDLYACNSTSVLRSTDKGITWIATANTGASKITVLYVSPSGKLYLGAVTSNAAPFEGVFTYDKVNNSWAHLAGSPLKVTAIIEDATNNLYVGTGSTDNLNPNPINYGAGVYRYSGSVWTQINTGISTVSGFSVLPFIKAFSFLNSGELITATYGNGVLKYSAGSWSQYGTGLNSLNVNCLFATTSGTLFAGTDAGVSSTNGSTWKNASNGLTVSKPVRALVGLSNGAIYAGMGFYHYQKGDVTGELFFTTNNGSQWQNAGAGFNSTSVLSMTANSNGKIFASANGVWTYNGSVWTYSFGGNKIPSNKIFGLAKNSKGHLFAICSNLQSNSFGYGGVFRSTDNGSTWISINNGIKCQGLTSIFVDSKDNIWIGGNQFVGGNLITTQWSNPDLYRSIDNGNTWTKNTSIATCHVGYFFINEDSNGKLYVTHAFFAGQTNVSSTTDYTTFDNTLTGSSVAPVAGRVYGLGISPNNDVFVGVETGYGILRSTSNGAAGSFSPLLNNNNPGPFTGTGPYGNNSIYIDPNTGNLFGAATHGYINGVQSPKNIWGALGANTTSLGINGQFMFPFNNLPDYSSLTSMICDSRGNAYLNINSGTFANAGLYVGSGPFNSSTPFTKVIFTGSISYYFTNFMMDDCGYLYGNSVSGAGIYKSATLVNVPSVSRLLSPLNSSQFVSPTTTLTWTHPCTTASFDLQVATDVNFTNVILNQSNINSTSSVMGSGILNNNAPYFWRVRAVNSIGSGKWSNVYTFTTSPAANRHWVGAASTAWSNPANWSLTAGGTGGAPAPLISDNVFFDGGSSIDCTIDLDIEVSSFTMNPSYSGTVSQGTSSVKVGNSMNLSRGTFAGGSGSIDVSGPFNINGSTFTSTTNLLTLNDQFDFSGGSFFHNNGTVKFNGTSTQTISGSRVTDFNNIIVTNASANPGVQIQSDQNLHGVLTLANNVVFDADGSGSGFIFKLISSGDNPTQDAAIDILPGGAKILGNITVQRYMSVEGINNGRVYRYISSPLLDATVQDIQNEIPVSGTFTGASACSTCGASASMFGYTEDVITDMDGSGAANSNDGYFAFPSSSNNEALQNGKGYAMYVRGDLLSSALWDVRGTPSMANTSAVDLPVSFTSSNVIEDDGWNLVGNPLPSTIDWNSSGWSKNNIDGSVYVPDNSGAALLYATYNGATGTNGGSRYIALGQAFWVKANGSGTPKLQANENVKAPDISTTFFRTKPLQNLLRIALVSATAKDETVIHFRDDATDDFDSHADARKRPNATINLSSKLSNGKNLAINSLPTLNCNSTILLDVENTTPGVYRLDFSELESFPNTVAISLSDNFANTKLDVRKELSYDFAVSTSSLSYGASRFEINFSVTPPDPNFKPAVALVCEGADARIIVNNSQINATYTLLTENKIVSDSITGNGGVISMIIKNENIQKDKNMFTIQSEMKGCSQIIKKDITFGTSTPPSIISVQEGMTCRQDAVTLKASSSSNADLYNWYEEENAVNFIENMHDSIFVTPALSKSKTYYVSSVNEAGCEGLKTPIEANVIYYDAASITETTDSLSSNYSTGNQWFYNNESIPFATSQSIKVQLPGTYTVQVNHEGCITSADHNYVVTGIEWLSNTIKVYPNPTHHEFELELPDYIKNIHTVKVINSVGQQVGVIDMLHENNKTTGKFQMNNLPTGIYIVSIVSTTKSYEVKVIKE